MRSLGLRYVRTMRQTVSTCPTCGSDRVVPIVYGMPSMEAVEDYDAGKVQLGGCVITDNDPHWSCRSCDAHWG